MIVVDASALIEVLLKTPSGLLITPRLLTENETLHAPHLLDLEVAQVLRRQVRVGALDPARALQALEDLADFPLTRCPHDWLLPKIWALRNNLTAYDAAYVVLAETLGATLITRDAALASASGHQARIELV